jgi:23S rRNA (cytidine1920-2'-O)/16S rRNA (cytidine1409-2'-O)-methyltransferase
MAGKIRLDLYMAEKGLAETREKAKALVLAGNVYVDGRKAEKPSIPVEDGSAVTVKPPECEFVSRGGYKLKKALEVFRIDAVGKTAVDIGASTGGFTDCLLKNGAAKVYAVDVGYGQLDWRLRNDPRVVVRERCNARYLKPEDFPERMDLSVTDVSFISLRLILPVAKALTTEDGVIVALIKPQFEAGREQVGKKGVVRDKKVHEEVLHGIVSFAEGIGLIPAGLDYSPIKGPNGNIEYVSCFLKRDQGMALTTTIEEIVNEAHERL